MIIGVFIWGIIILSISTISVFITLLCVKLKSLQRQINELKGGDNNGK